MPEPHDFAVRVSHIRLTRSQRPSHPRLTFGDDWPQRPLHRGGMPRTILLFYGNDQGFIFSRGAGQGAANEQ